MCGFYEYTDEQRHSIMRFHVLFYIKNQQFWQISQLEKSHDRSHKTHLFL